MEDNFRVQSWMRNADRVSTPHPATYHQNTYDRQKHKQADGWDEWRPRVAVFDFATGEV
jgi:hypothetical protein